MRRLLRQFDRLSLSQKLASLLAAIFLGSLVLLIALLSSVFSRYAVKIIDHNSALIMDTMAAVRHYTQNEVNPLLSPMNDQSSEFNPQAIPFYSSQRVFANLKLDPRYSEYAYREAALNPTNPADRADSEEARLIQAFRADSSLQQLTGERASARGRYHYVARPIKVDHHQCLACHSTYQKAPRSLVETYGKDHGFGWMFGEVVGAQVITVPVRAIYQAKWNLLSYVGVLNAVAFVATAGLLLWFLSKVIVTPMREISARAYQASIRPDTVDFSEKQRHDEIGMIAQSFDRMKQSLTIAMNLLKQQD